MTLIAFGTLAGAAARHEAAAAQLPEAAGLAHDFSPGSSCAGGALAIVGAAPFALGTSYAATGTSAGASRAHAFTPSAAPRTASHASRERLIVLDDSAPL